MKQASGLQWWQSCSPALPGIKEGDPYNPSSLSLTHAVTFFLAPQNLTPIRQNPHSPHFFHFLCHIISSSDSRHIPLWVQLNHMSQTAICSSWDLFSISRPCLVHIINIVFIYGSFSSLWSFYKTWQGNISEPITLSVSSCLLAETWMDAISPHFVDPSGNYKNAQLSTFSNFLGRISPGSSGWMVEDEIFSGSW